MQVLVEIPTLTFNPTCAADTRKTYNSSTALKIVWQTAYSDPTISLQLPIHMSYCICTAAAAKASLVQWTKFLTNKLATMPPKMLSTRNFQFYVL